MTDPFPEKIASVAELENLLSEPTGAAVEELSHLDGDLLVLGAGGKMGPSLARMAQRAFREAGVRGRVIAVSRFSNSDLEQQLHREGIETIPCDLLDESQLKALPDAPHVISMAAMKFGAAGQEPLVWAMNCHLPALICRRFSRSKIVAFSTGNIYGLSPVERQGSREADPLEPQGDYAASCLGRERIYEYFSRSMAIPTALIRLNYAVELRYGVLYDIGRAVFAGAPIDVTMGFVNVIWQADANAAALCAFSHVAVPPFVLNVTGPEVLSVRSVAAEFGRLFGRPVIIEGAEAADALLSCAALCHRLLGFPRVDAARVIRWIAAWIEQGGESLGKPTHFETRDGRF